MYRGSFEISSIDQALQRVGLREIRRIFSAASMTHAFEKFHANIDWRSFWFDSLLAGRLTEKICASVSDITGTENLVGLIHDVGQLILKECFPEEYNQVDYLLDMGQSRLAAEKQIFRTTHMDVGYVLSWKWDLSKRASIAILNHGCPFQVDESERTRLLAIALYTADRWIATY